ncbi:MAG: transposase [Microthrixaceae bacterium]
MLDIDASLVEIHSENKQNTAATYKHGFGFHPMFCFADATGETLAALLRPGNAGANTVVDHVTVLDTAINQLPASIAVGHGAGDDPALAERQVVLRADSAGCTHGFLAACRQRNVGLYAHPETVSVPTTHHSPTHHQPSRTSPHTTTATTPPPAPAPPSTNPASAPTHSRPAHQYQPPTPPTPPPKTPHQQHPPQTPTPDHAAPTPTPQDPPPHAPAPQQPPAPPKQPAVPQPRAPQTTSPPTAGSVPTSTKGHHDNPNQ